MKNRKIYCLNPISKIGLNKFRSGYTITDNIEEAHGVLVRSADMLTMEFRSEERRVGKEC